MSMSCARRSNAATRAGVRSDHHRRRRSRPGNLDPAVPAGHRPQSWRGTAFGGARGRTDVPKIVDWYMDGKIDIDPMITHTMPLDEINKGFDLMHAGESHPQCSAASAMTGAASSP
jgi:Zn-dependent alcohol dehydrogenase